MSKTGINPDLYRSQTKSVYREKKNADKLYKTLWGKEVQGANTEKPQFINLGFHLPHTPVLPPKNLENTAPVYPIKAATSNCNNKKILPFI